MMFHRDDVPSRDEGFHILPSHNQDLAWKHRKEMFLDKSRKTPTF